MPVLRNLVRVSVVLLFAVFAGGCADEDNDKSWGIVHGRPGPDCNDSDPTIHPGASEVCDFRDNNCDGLIDESFVTFTYYADTDRDGYGNPNSRRTACRQPPGYVPNNLDCDDTTTLSARGRQYWADADGDLFTATNVSVMACALPAGYRDRWTVNDCNDANAMINPGATDIPGNNIDEDCVGGDATGGTTDADGDGVLAGTDCDDNNATVGGPTNWYEDLDADGFGDEGGVAVVSCTQPPGTAPNNTDCDDKDHEIGGPTTFYEDNDLDDYGDPLAPVQVCSPFDDQVANDDDCNDSDAAINPGATEVCDGADNNCAGGVDEGVTTTYYQNLDGDPYGNPNVTQQACSAPTGYVADGTDCDDSNATIGGPTIWYLDSDGDTYGNPNVTQQACSAPSGYVATGTDCDDSNTTFFALTSWYLDLDTDGYGAGAPQVSCAPPSPQYVVNNSDCDDIDVTIGGPTTWYADTDGDSYGNPSGAQTACTQPGGYVPNNTDCDDSNAQAYPGNTEICDTIDNDCDVGVDEGVGSTWYADSDLDGYGDPNNTVLACTQPPGYVPTSTDCDDGDILTYFGATELCDGYDNNCDGTNDGDDPTLGAWSGTFGATPGLPITDNNTTTSTLDLTSLIPASENPNTVASVTVTLTHTWLSDLTITLVAPDNTSVVLMQADGGSGNDLNGTIFSDAATNAINGAGAGSAPFAGSWIPQQPLSGFSSAATLVGVWTLLVVDSAGGDVGTLVAWELELETDNDQDGDGVYACGDCDDLDALCGADCMASSCSGTGPTCPAGWTLYEELGAAATCFSYVSAYMAWNDALTNCQTLATGAHLAVIDSAAENTAARNVTTQTIQAHIGFQDYGVAGNNAPANGFLDVLGGNTSDYHSFGGGEPSNGPGENCVAYFESTFSNPLSWNDVPCTGTLYPSICEVAATP